MLIKLTPPQKKCPLLYRFNAPFQAKRLARRYYVAQCSILLHYTNSLSLSLSLSLSHCLPHFLSLSHCLPHFLSLSLIVSFSFSFFFHSLSLSQCFFLSFSISFNHSLRLPLFLTPSLSLRTDPSILLTGIPKYA